MHSIVTTTVATEEDADMLARLALHHRLAACIQVEDITSYYTWEGSTHEDAEKRLTLKTRTALVPQLTDILRSNHPYKVPQILEVQIASGLTDYLNWIDENTQPLKPVV
jgi:periplasmic divalent cation tolerance protein